MRGFITGVLATIVVGLVVAYLVLRSGLIPAGADTGALPLEKWVAKTSLHATLNSDAPKGPNPVALTDANLIEGIHLYGSHCVACHGSAAGKTSASPIAKGEYPRPPQLASDGVEDDPEGVTFWKVKHGIRWTGMPSWKNALNDKQIWTLALFLKHMDKLPPAAEAVWKQVGLRKPAQLAPIAPPVQPAPPPAQSAPPPSSSTPLVEPTPTSPAPQSH